MRQENLESTVRRLVTGFQGNGVTDNVGQGIGAQIYKVEGHNVWTKKG